MSTLADIVFDCAHPASLARFWASVLDGYSVAPYDEEELSRLRAMGIDDPEDDPGVLVLPPSPDKPRLYFQKVPEAKVAKNRVHLDIRAADRAAEVERLVGLGARKLYDMENEAGYSWTTMADPEGNEFCVLEAG
jgi:hypothetical protein